MNTSPKDLAQISGAASHVANDDLSYRSWRETAGYSDGDGGLLLTPEMYTLSLGFDWADSYGPQLDGVRRFLVSEGLKPERVYALGGEKPVWHLRLSNRCDLLTALIEMVPFLIKKKRQAESVIRYLRDEITGEQLVEDFNRAILDGTRLGYMRSLKMPYTHSQGVEKGREFLQLGPRRRWKASRSIAGRMRARKETGTTVRDIVDEAGVSRSTIYRGLTDKESKS